MGYYWMRPADDDPAFTPAFAEDLPADASRKLGRKLRATEPIVDWVELEFSTERSMGDFPLTLEGTLCSDRLKRILDHGRGALDAVEWLPCRALIAGRCERYWILHFLDRSKSLDESRTQFDSYGNPFRPVLDGQRVLDRMLLPDPDPYGWTVFVHERIATEIRAAGLEGVILDEQRVTPR